MIALLELVAAFVAGAAGFAFLGRRRRRRLDVPRWPTPLSPPLSHVTRRAR